ASWWVGALSMLPFVFIGGLLIVRKIRRFDLVFSFITMAAVSSFWLGLQRGVSIGNIATQTFLHSSLFFFAFIMMVEPLTTPPMRSRRMAYGAFTGLLSGPGTHIGGIYFTAELALLAGNLFSYLISPKAKLKLKLKEKILAANDTYDFVFSPDQKPKFKAGQYLEWTLGHEKPDNRGNRRYFTICSSPTEDEIRLGVKFYPEPSSFKTAMMNMQVGDTLVVSQLAGDFVLPKNRNEKLVFISGGIGVTPMRSMVRYLLDKN
ncbi:MAG: FAD-dependent oxidoreductase, partial [Candidatus Liptonbacteria bacterium]|nr:FAD-dependent oxidoreductase [Candidatus Liptonbacteria bacterium]